ncbi:MAG: GTPase ObgE [Lachnospiraceae bacterium]|nr:GTPase ObgE [Lachnospiraceae bacterium]
MSFADRARIIIRSGKGGDGHVSFRREKYVPDGGPDGGDGGKGGDIIFEVDGRVNTLTEYRHKRKFQAENGEEGGKKNRHGKSGSDLVLKVPEGTVIKDAATEKVITDMSGENNRVVLLEGGRGGLGNQHFATSRMQAPKYAKPGGEAIELEVILELKVIADVGLIGFPNVGKSTFLSRVTNAEPKIANYHFTTLSPNLGVVDLSDGGFVIADIPGLIEGASEGMGLGHEFLRHIERTKVLLHVVDGASAEGRDPVEDIRAINNELMKYDKELMKKPQIVAVNKLDLIPDESERKKVLDTLKDAFKDEPYSFYGISAVTGENVKEVLFAVKNILDKLPKEKIIYESEFDIKDLKKDEIPYTIEIDDGVYVVEGPKIEKMLGYTNLESEKGFLFFQKFIKEQGIQDQLKKMGIEEGDTVRMYGLEFEYYE